MAPLLRGQSAAFPSAGRVEGGPHDRAARAAASRYARVPRAPEGEVYVGEGVQVSARVVAFCKLCLLLRVNNPEADPRSRVHKKLYPYYGHVTRVVRSAEPTRVWRLIQPSHGTGYESLAARGVPLVSGECEKPVLFSLVLWDAQFQAPTHRIFTKLQNARLRRPIIEFTSPPSHRPKSREEAARRPESTHSFEALTPR